MNQLTSYYDNKLKDKFSHKELADQGCYLSADSSDSSQVENCEADLGATTAMVHASAFELPLGAMQLGEGANKRQHTESSTQALGFIRHA